MEPYPARGGGAKSPFSNIVKRVLVTALQNKRAFSEMFSEKSEEATSAIHPKADIKLVSG
jgi:hypothetical protein